MTTAAPGEPTTGKDSSTRTSSMEPRPQKPRKAHDTISIGFVATIPSGTAGTHPRLLLQNVLRGTCATPQEG